MTIDESILVEVLDSHGRVQSHERLALHDGKRSFTLGRAVHADVTLNDAHTAPLHASVEITPEGKILVSDLNSVNGIVVSGKRYRNAQSLEMADGMLQLGRTRLRVRTARENLAPEKPDQLHPASILRDPAWIAGIGALAGVAQLVYSTWLGVPRDLATNLVTALISAAAAAGA